MADKKGKDPKSSVMTSHGMLSMVSETRHGEVGTALMLTINVFLLLLAYYLLKVAREPLILVKDANGNVAGAEVKSYASAAQAVTLIFVAYAYGTLAKYVNRLKLISFVTLFFIANLLLFALLYSRGVQVGVPFFIWVGCFSVIMIAAQFWGFAADIYSEERGKRIFPILGIGSSVGAVTGSWIAKHADKLNPAILMLIAAVLLFVCVLLTAGVHYREGGRDKTTVASKPIVGASGFSLLFKDRYLLLIGAFIFVYNWVNTTGEFVLDKTLLASMPADADPKKFVQEFKGEYLFYANIVALVLQTVLVSRILRYFGVRTALFVMPIISLISYSGMAIFPILSFVFVAKITENSLDYSLQNTARQALWLVTSREAKYKAKQVIDTFLQRAGDVMSAGLVLLGTAIGFGVKGFAVANAGLVLAWLGIMLFLTREHKKRSDQHHAEHADEDKNRLETVGAADGQAKRR